MAGLSDRSFARGASAPHLAEALFENLAHVVAQSETDGERFLALGARPVTVSGNLKVDTAAAAGRRRGAAGAAQRRSARARPGRPISTHDGEEEIAAEVHLALKQRAIRDR